MSWARQQIKENDAPVRLLTTRGGDKDAVIVAEIATDRERIIKGGRTLTVKRLMNGKGEI